MIFGYCDLDDCLEYATLEKIIDNKVLSLCKDHIKELIKSG